MKDLTNGRPLQLHVCLQHFSSYKKKKKTEKKRIEWDLRPNIKLHQLVQCSTN